MDLVAALVAVAAMEAAAAGAAVRILRIRPHHGVRLLPPRHLRLPDEIC